VGVITRVRRDAALYEPAPPRPPTQHGRPRTKGRRRPTLEKIVTSSLTRWKTGALAHGYGEGARHVQITSSTAVWSHSGKPVVPLRWVLIRDPKGRFAPQALLTTNQQLTPEQLLTSFRRRWQLEVTVDEARAHRGVETQRPWSANATARTTPAVLALDSIVTLMAAPRLGPNTMPVRTATWYRKEQPAFSDTIALVRRCVWSHGPFATSGTEAEVVKIPRARFERLTDALCDAA
jgi:hypothetical protein